MTTLSERDQIILNAYLDNALTQSERAAFEQKLASNSALREEMESLRRTIALVKLTEPVRIPRNFTLDPAVYSRQAQRGFLGWFAGGLPRMAMAGAAAALTLIFAGAVIVGMSRYGRPLQSAVQPEIIMEQDTANEAADVTEAPFAVEENTDDAAMEPSIAGSSLETSPTPPSTLAGAPEDNTYGSASGGGVGDTGGVVPAESAPSPTPEDEVAMAVPGESSRSAQTIAPASADGEGDDLDESQATAPIPFVPIAIGGLVLVLLIGIAVARRTRRR